MEHFEEHLNEGSKSEQPTRPVDLRDDGVDIDLPSREKIERKLKYLKNNKAAGTDSIAAELLKNDGPNLSKATRATSYQSNAHYCDMLRQNKKRLFRILLNPTRIKTGRSTYYLR
jgi:hypothetical protein